MLSNIYMRTKLELQPTHFEFQIDDDDESCC